MKIPVAIKVLRENTSPKANKEILDVSPSTLSSWEYSGDPLAAGVGCGFCFHWGFRRPFVIPQISTLNLLNLWAMVLVCDEWGWIE